LERWDYQCHAILFKQGHEVRAKDLEKERLEDAKRAGLQVFEDGQSDQDYAWADYIFSSLPNDLAFLAVVKEVVIKAPKNAVYIDTSTISMKASSAAAVTLAQAGIHYLRVAVSGNNHMAAAANLTILSSGPKEIYDRILPMLSAWGPSQFYLGEKEQARLMKLVVNLLIAQTSAMLAEGLTLGRLGNLDWQDMWKVLSSFSSWFADIES
jgi:3-hydroxyisobutyrate dehydrogenase